MTATGYFLAASRTSSVARRFLSSPRIVRGAASPSPPSVSPFLPHSSAPISSRLYTTTRTLMMQSSISGNEILASFSPRKEHIGNNVADAMQALANADAVCFDVDSTVIGEEGIDVLADYLGKGEEVAALTRKAMEGSTKFRDALAARLGLLQPSKRSIENCLKDKPFQLTPGVEDLIETLIEARIDVYLVSGGFRIMIEPLAMKLCVAKTNIYANTILFDDDGNYIGFDTTEPTSADMGKPKALEQIQQQGGYQTMVMIGDGATDAQAKPPAAAFIGFGGVVVRPVVKDKACWFVTDFEDLAHVVSKFGKHREK